MSKSLSHDQALVLFDRAYRSQMRGEVAEAMALYRRSIGMHPTAEAHTFLGWTYSMLGRYEEAIEACQEAIEIDPGYGNPYNDIGAYLLELDDYEEAIPWLEKAIEAPRYDAPQFPHMNLGRAYEATGKSLTALKWYDKALEIDPLYRAAHSAKYALLGRLN